MHVDDLKTIDAPDPIFRVVTHKGIGCAGTMLYVFGQEMPEVVKFEHSTSYAGAGDLVTTTITITLWGSQVVTEFHDPGK